MKKTVYQLGKKVAIVSALAVCTLFCSDQAFSQGVSINATGTGTTPDPSAILDLNISTKGFLMPRVTLTGVNDGGTISLPQKALMVYNTGGALPAGFYYNSGTTLAPNWISIGSSSLTAGKDIDVSGSTIDIEDILNYVNTITSTDGGGVGVASDLTVKAPALKDLILGAGGAEYARILSTGNVGIGTTAPAFKLDVNGTIRTGQNGLDGQLNIFSEQGGTDFTYTINPNNAATQNVILTLPPDDGLSTQVLATDGSGNLSWATSFTNPMTTWGDVIFGGQTPAGVPTRLGAGTAGMVLHTNGVGSDPTWGKVDLAAGPGTQVTGVLPVVNGGTGVATIANNGIMLGAGTSPVTTLVGTDMQTIRNNAGVWTNNSNILNDGTHVGIGLTTADMGASQAFLDIKGANSALGNDSVGLSIRFGDAQNLPTDVSQITFGYNGTVNYRHAIKTRHNSTVGNANAIEFYLWDPATQSGTPTAIGRNRMFSINNSGIEFYGPLRPGGSAGTAGQVLVSGGAGVPTWSNASTGTVTTISVATANGLAGTVATPTTTPVITLTTTQTGMLKGNGTAITGVTGTQYGAAYWTDANTIGSTAVGGTGTVLHGNTGAAPTYSAVSLTADVTGILPLANGGTAVNNATSVPANTVFAGPTSGGAGAGGYRALVPADIPDISGTYWKLGGNSPGGASIIGTNDNSAVTFKTGTGALGLGTDAAAKVITVGNVTGATAVNVNTGTAGTTYTTTNGIFTLNTGTGAISLGTDAVAKTVTVGNVTGATAVNVRAGTGASTFETTGAGTLVIGGAASTGAITVGSSSNAQTVNVGTGAGVSTVNIATGAAANVVNIDNGASAGVVQIGKSNAVTINTSGNVGIGGAGTNTWKLEITGKVKSTGINETSDVRLKKNFASIDGALNKVLAMNGKYYDWRTTEFPTKGLAEGRQIGVIAQEMEKILPEVVATDGEGYKSVEYGHIVPVLIEAIKEQQKIIDGQKSTIDDLKASLENVLNRVNIMEKNADLNSSKVEK